MSTNDTTRYQLNQWQGDDAFLRAEFNEDNRKLDAALWGLETRIKTLERGLGTVSYNTAQLLLRDYYEGKDVGFKRAVLADGFMDSEQLETLSPELLHINSALYLTSQMQPEMKDPYGSDYVGTSTTARGGKTYTASAFCIVTGFKLKWSYWGTYVGKLISALRVNGAEAASASIQLSGKDETVRESILSFDTPTLLRPGDEVSLTIWSNGGRFELAEGTQGGEFGGAFVLIAFSAEEGFLRSKPVRAADTFDRALAWVRHAGGDVGVSLVLGDGTEAPLEHVERRDTVNLQGAACVEDAYRLDCPGSNGGEVAVNLDLALSGGAHMEVFDYGVALQ